MTNSYPYPALEHRDKPTHPWQVIDEELCMYDAGASFRGGIVALSCLYGKTSLVIGFAKYAKLMNVATALAGTTEAEQQTGLNMDFYAGEILATHCLIRPLPQQTRDHLYRCDAFSDVAPPNRSYYDEDGVEHYLLPSLADTRKHAEGLIAFKDHVWQDSFAELPDQLQERAIEASIHAYADDRNASSHENDFLVGFSNAAEYVYTFLAEEYPQLP